MNLNKTLGNIEWLRENEEALKQMLPEVWTHAENLSVLKLGFKLKLLGVDWRDVKELPTILAFLEKIGLMQFRNGCFVRANPGRVFPSVCSHQPQTE